MIPTADIDVGGNESESDVRLARVRPLSHCAHLCDYHHISTASTLLLSTRHTISSVSALWGRVSTAPHWLTGLLFVSLTQTTAHLCAVSFPSNKRCGLNS